MDRSPVGVRLGEEFEGLTLSDRALGVWSGFKDQAQMAIHVLAEACPDSAQAIMQRCRDFQLRQWPFLPRLDRTFSESGYTVVCEEWLQGISWSLLMVQPERAREIAAELFDILDEVHSAGLTCGRLRAEQLIFDQASCRLRLLGVTARHAAEDSPQSDRLSALSLLAPILGPEEQAECAACQSAAQVSRVLRRGRVPRRLGEATFVGQEKPLRRLDQAWTESHLVTLEGPAGGGKTRLLREWSRTLAARVLWAKAEREVAPSPFQMFAEPIATLELELARRPDLASLLVHELGVELPLLENLSGHQGASPGLQRGVVVMLSLLLAVVGKDQPTLLVLDDCQWADPLTLSFLEYWAQNGEGMLVVATFRGEEIDPDHALRGLAGKRISLAPLTTEQAHQLLLSREPRASSTLRESAIRQAGGNPFSLLAFMFGVPLEDCSDSARFQELDSNEREALGLAAVLGREFRHDDVEGCLRRTIAFRQALQTGLLEPSSAGYRFIHDRVRDLVLASLHPDETGRHHLRAARYLSQSGTGNIFDVAYHFQAAGAAREGFEPSLAASRLALQEHDSATAIFYLRAALNGAEGQPVETQRKLHSDLGDCYRLTGQYSEALDCFRRALPLASDDVIRAGLMQLIGDVEFKRGRLEPALEAVEKGLALLGERLPKRVEGTFLREALVQTARSLIPGWKIKSSEPRDSDLLRIDLYNRLAYIRWFLEGPIPSISAHLRELNLAQQHPPSRSLARAQATHAIAMSAFPLWPRALRFGVTALQTAHQIGDTWGEGQAAHFYGAALLGASRLVPAGEQLEAAVKKLRQTGDRWEENGARYHLALVYLHQGELEKAARLSQETHEIGVAIDDRLAAGDNLFTWARAVHGELPRRALEKEKAHPNPDIQRACELLSAEALLEIRQGCPQIAADLLAQAVALYRSRRAQNMYSAPLPCWLVTALRLAAARQQGEERRRLLRQARKKLTSALGLARKYRTNLPHALREQALLLAIDGRLEEARAGLERSILSAKELGMSFEVELGQSALAHRGWSADVSGEQSHGWLLGF